MASTALWAGAAAAVAIIIALPKHRSAPGARTDGTSAGPASQATRGQAAELDDALGEERGAAGGGGAPLPSTGGKPGTGSMTGSGGSRRRGGRSARGEGGAGEGDGREGGEASTAPLPLAQPPPPLAEDAGADDTDAAEEDAPLPEGAIDFDEFRARKNRARAAVDVFVLLAIAAAAGWVAAHQYRASPLEAAAEWLPREAALAGDLLRGARRLPHDARGAWEWAARAVGAMFGERNGAK